MGGAPSRRALPTSGEGPATGRVGSAAALNDNAGRSTVKAERLEEMPVRQGAKKSPGLAPCTGSRESYALGNAPSAKVGDASVSVSVSAADSSTVTRK